MSLFRNLMLAFGLCITTYVHAWSSIVPTKVVVLQPRANGSLYVVFDKASTEGGCTNSVGVLRVDPELGITEVGFKLMSQSIQLAFVTNKTLALYVHGCLDSQYSKIYAVDVMQ